MTKELATVKKGGSFLIEETAAPDIFTPEDLTEEQTMIRDMTEQFVEDEVLPLMEKIEHQQWDVTVALLRRCGELGLLGIEVPEKYGGENLDKVSAMIVAEKLARVASFAVSYGGHSGIGTLPIVYFGKEEHKRKYLPLLCKAEKISAYALSEAGSGSDALAAKANAVRSTDGAHWVINGEKMWITNAAFADMFVTFAQVDGKQFSCFIVEKDYPGVSTGAEENKMGLKGSSTRTLVLENAAQVLKAIEEYAVECSILKVFCSEVLDFVVDEAVQVYGGYGYSAEYSVERYYRDSRVNRIFEGTNEINRLLITGMLLKRAAAGHLPLYESARRVVDEVMSSSLPAEPSGPFGAELAAIAQAKKALLFTAGAAVQKFADAIRDEQEVLMHLSNIVMEIYAMDTTIHRLVKNDLADPHVDVARTFINDAMSRIDYAARQVLAAVAEGDALRTQLAALRRLLRWLPIDTVRTRQRIAEFLVESNRYAL